MLHSTVMPIRRPAPRIIDICEIKRVDYWCGVLGVSRSKLCSAVFAAGNDLDAVRGYLRRHPAVLH